MALDRGSERGLPVVITREESRSCVHHALDALQNEFSVAVTGQSSLGKTRGSMMYAMQTLLYRKSAVLYIGYKSEKMMLFLPREDGTYRVWRGNTFDSSRSLFKQDQSLVAVIDPPEEGMYSSKGMCRVLKFVSNNAEKNFRNWEKDRILLVTSMPTDRELMAMTQVLWDEDKTPHPRHLDTLSTMKEKMTEIKKRIELVGPIPRLVSHCFAMLSKSVYKVQRRLRETSLILICAKL
ncbi:hypothetical protein BWQ96_05619 [Gracilariopsis chorda]|uniref:Uncharacterized protein n=1 Tax=Gracilariopsis chorda TaxID=448386 RepID=A0A2V3IR98_9FLOR|nr:hypothetical protein BWQ96_05619 [Gracilariopsis chorda]|eukprot:PXF44624.1 hypothetical protein BWQ96_05619 [Gracilariopsis chorda]